jgi:hypothetical protein
MEYTGYHINEGWRFSEIKAMLDCAVRPVSQGAVFRRGDAIVAQAGTDKTLRVIDTNPPDMEH